MGTLERCPQIRAVTADERPCGGRADSERAVLKTEIADRDVAGSIAGERPYRAGDGAARGFDIDPPIVGGEKGCWRIQEIGSGHRTQVFRRGDGGIAYGGWIGAEINVVLHGGRGRRPREVHLSYIACAVERIGRFRDTTRDEGLQFGRRQGYGIDPGLIDGTLEVSHRIGRIPSDVDRAEVCPCMTDVVDGGLESAAIVHIHRCLAGFDDEGDEGPDVGSGDESRVPVELRIVPVITQRAVVADAQP